MIHISELITADKGRWVRLKNFSGKNGTGRIKSWNDSFIFVVFQCDNDWENYADYTGEAVNCSNLEFIEQDDSEIYAAERANPCDFCTAPFNGDPEHDGMICNVCRGNVFK